MSRRTNILLNIDWLTVVLYFILVMFGWMNIFAVNYNDQYKSIFDLSQRYGIQIVWIIAALILIFFIFIIDSKFYHFFSYILYGITIFLLMAVLVLGKEIHGARSWFSIGGFQFQPSEFAKVTTALVIARYISSYNVKITKFKSLLKLFGFIALPAGLIFLQPDMGSAMVYVAFLFVLFREGLPGWVLLFVALISVLFLSTLLYPKVYILIVLISLAGIVFYIIDRKFKNFVLSAGILITVYVIVRLLAFYQIVQFGNYLSLLIALGISSLSYIILILKFKIQKALIILATLYTSIAFTFSVDYVFHNILKPHQQTRVNILLGKETDPLGYGYNVNQSMIAIGSGGFTGKGFLNGTQTKFNFVPEQSTDFIFCTVGEEWGFWGSSLVIILFAGLLIRLITLAERQRSHFVRVYGYGVISILFFHLAVNIGMTIGLFPVIGIPLPFFSYGGSSLLAFTLLLFIFIRLDATRLSVLS
jgi:rod shape determining protein RodA